MRTADWVRHITWGNHAGEASPIHQVNGFFTTLVTYFLHTGCRNIIILRYDKMFQEMLNINFNNKTISSKTSG